MALLSGVEHKATGGIARVNSLVVVVGLSGRPADAKRTCGYAGMEAINAMVIPLNGTF